MVYKVLWLQKLGIAKSLRPDTIILGYSYYYNLLGRKIDNKSYDYQYTYANK